MKYDVFISHASEDTDDVARIPRRTAEVKVDHLEVAHFIHLLLSNEPVGSCLEGHGGRRGSRNRLGGLR